MHVLVEYTDEEPHELLMLENELWGLLLKSSRAGSAADRLVKEAKKTPDSLFGHVPDLDSRKAAEIAKEREKWKSLWPSKHC